MEKLTADEESLFEKIQGEFTPVGWRKDIKETGPLYHGTKADRQIGDLLEAEFCSKLWRTGESKFCVSYRLSGWRGFCPITPHLDKRKELTCPGF
ncbi:MAG: hypothetical protein FWF49_06015 [Oscillospiraceae bacterium]|nr:hypothetical protein [Oscillospiraceae bacterium]